MRPLGKAGSEWPVRGGRGALLEHCCSKARYIAHNGTDLRLLKFPRPDAVSVGSRTLGGLVHGLADGIVCSKRILDRSASTDSHASSLFEGFEVSLEQRMITVADEGVAEASGSVTGRTYHARIGSFI